MITITITIKNKIKIKRNDSLAGNGTDPRILPA